MIIRGAVHRSRIGLVVTLTSLAVLFASGLLSYVLIRYNTLRATPLAPLQIPYALWLSTAVLLLASFALQRSLAFVRRERHESFRLALSVTCIAGFAFLVIQFDGLHQLLADHFAGKDKNPGLAGLVFVLVLLHAVHVLGGLAVLAEVTRRAFVGRYDHEYHSGVILCAWYWHFLDVTWLVMFSVFLLTR